MTVDDAHINGLEPSVSSSSDGVVPTINEFALNDNASDNASDTLSGEYINRTGISIILHEASSSSSSTGPLGGDSNEHNSEAPPLNETTAHDIADFNMSASSDSGIVSQSTSFQGNQTITDIHALRSSMSNLQVQPDVSKANISQRAYIALMPYPLPPGTRIPYTLGMPHDNPLGIAETAFEPTNTIVLTSTKGMFVDLRFYQPVRKGEPDLPNDGGPRSRLEWAFAGTITSIEVPEESVLGGDDKEDVEADEDKDKGKAKDEGVESNVDDYEEGDSFEDEFYGPVRHCVWEHWIDNRYPVGSPNIPVDESDMYPVSETQTLEHGHCYIPDLKAHVTYEELWQDLPIEPCYPEQTKLSIVLCIQNEQYKVRGVIVRLGQICQGILMKGEYSTVERWEYFEKKNAEGQVVDGDWERTAKIGDLFLPCAVTFRPDILRVHGVVKFNDYEWNVEEMVEWE